MYPWCDTQTVQSATYAVGDPVYSGRERGTVVTVDATKTTMAIMWDDGDGSAIVYPMDAGYLSKFPW